MRLIEKENFHLIDKDYEVWGLESEEVIISLVGSFLLTLPLLLVHVLLLTVFPGIWLAFLLKIKNYKSHEKVRGRIKRLIWNFIEEKIYHRRMYYV
jgi:hypothetical protein